MGALRTASTNSGFSNRRCRLTRALPTVHKTKRPARGRDLRLYRTELIIVIVPGVVSGETSESIPRRIAEFKKNLPRPYALGREVERDFFGARPRRSGRNPATTLDYKA